MHLTLVRDILQPERTLGLLSIDGVFNCCAIEDAVRPDGVKIPGKTAIPYGRYQVKLTTSARFGRLLPILIGDAAFETAWKGVRIHRGNTEADTEGCIIVGRRRNATRMIASGAAEIDLVERMRRAVSRGEAITLDIVPAG